MKESPQINQQIVTVPGDCSIRCINIRFIKQACFRMFLQLLEMQLGLQDLEEVKFAPLKSVDAIEGTSRSTRCSCIRDK